MGEAHNSCCSINQDRLMDGESIRNITLSAHVRWGHPDFLYATLSDSHLCGFL
jgi:hypothetical protein